MTLANQITLARIALIPVFVALANAYAGTYAEGNPEPFLRWAAILVFLVAAGSDALDGFVARKFNQRSRLGAILDPIADKGLLISAILALTFLPWPHTFPLWFPILVIARDAVIVSGAMALQKWRPLSIIQPSLWGKAATACQMAAVAWILIGLPEPSPVIYLAALLTAVSGIFYMHSGWNTFRGDPVSEELPK